MPFDLTTALSGELPKKGRELSDEVTNTLRDLCAQVWIEKNMAYISSNSGSSSSFKTSSVNEALLHVKVSDTEHLFFVVEGEAGTGGFATVFFTHKAILLKKDGNPFSKWRSAVLPVDNVIKKESLVGRDRESELDRIEAEAKYLSENHTRDVYIAYTQDNAYIVMENLGKSLDKIMAELPTWPFEELILLACGVTEELVRLESNEVIHRDLKPGNLCIKADRSSRRTNMKVAAIDFGLANITLQKAGTIYYMPPEILTTNKYNYAYDRWALGPILGEIFGQEPNSLFSHREQAIQNLEKFGGIRNNTNPHFCAVYQAKYRYDRLFSNRAKPPADYDLQILDDIKRILHELQYRDPQQRPGAVFILKFFNLIETRLARYKELRAVQLQLNQIATATTKLKIDIHTLLSDDIFTPEERDAIIRLHRHPLAIRSHYELCEELVRTNGTSSDYPNLFDGIHFAEAAIPKLEQKLTRIPRDRIIKCRDELHDIQTICKRVGIPFVSLHSETDLIIEQLERIDLDKTDHICRFNFDKAANAVNLLKTNLIAQYSNNTGSINQFFNDAQTMFITLGTDLNHVLSSEHFNNDDRQLHLHITHDNDESSPKFNIHLPSAQALVKKINKRIVFIYDQHLPPLINQFNNLITRCDALGFSLDSDVAKKQLSAQELLLLTQLSRATDKDKKEVIHLHNARLALTQLEKVTANYEKINPILDAIKSSQFNQTNSTGILEMQKYLNDPDLSPLQQFEKICSIAKKKTTRGLSYWYSHSSFFGNGRNHHVEALYQMLAKVSTAQPAEMDEINRFINDPIKNFVGIFPYNTVSVKPRV